jgi:hypothetical protein
MRCELLRLYLRVVLAGAVFTSALSAQYGTGNVADKDIGRPPQPPFLTFIGIIEEKLATDRSLPPIGPVAESLYEELRAQATPAGPAGEVVTSIRNTYDEERRAIEVIRTEFGTETTTVNRYEGTRPVSQEFTFSNGKNPQPKSWNYWVYDKSGKLTEFRHGSGDELQNHETNFKRDLQGRLTSFEYRQGAKDELFSRSEFRYSSDGRTIESPIYDAAGDVTRLTTQKVDDQGHVISAVIIQRDSRTKKLKAPLKIEFRYDEKGRLVEQNNETQKLEAGANEQDLPPGKVFIDYDDVKRTKTTTSASPEGMLASTVSYDASGAAIAMIVRAGNSNIDVKLECTYDSHQNWTSCRQIAKRGGVSTVAKMWRRTITYR